MKYEAHLTIKHNSLYHFSILLLLLLLLQLSILCLELLFHNLLGHNLQRNKRGLSHFDFLLPHKTFVNFYIGVLFHYNFLMKMVLLKLHELMMVVIKMR